MMKENLNSLLKDFDLYGVIKFSDYKKYRENKINRILKTRQSFTDNYNNYTRFDYAKSIIVLAMSFCEGKKEYKDTSVMANFAKGTDYHIVMKERIYKVINNLKSLYPDNKYEFTVDIGAIDEKYAAVLAGIGNIGKNGLLISKKYGSFIVLGTIITDIKFDQYDLHHEKDICGNCKRCIETCPVGALDNSYIDNKLCMSGLLQTKRIIKIDTIPKIKNMVYGCDFCQNVCPHNLITKKCIHPEFKPDDLASFNLKWFYQISEDKYKELFKNKAINWLKYPIILRNSIINATNNLEKGTLEIIEKSLIKYNKLDYFVKTLNNCKEILLKENE